MGTKIELLQNVLHQVKEKLASIQKERFKLNDFELPVKTKKRITDENFQKIIKLKNDDINAILDIKNEIIALDAKDDDFLSFKDMGFEDKITEMNKMFDETFAIVDQMKRETELLINSESGSNEFEDEDEIVSIGANQSNEFFKNNEELSKGSGDSDIVIPDERSNNDYIIEVFGQSLKKAIAHIIIYQPNDPIEYLSKFLHNYRRNELLKIAK